MRNPRGCHAPIASGLLAVLVVTSGCTANGRSVGSTAQRKRRYRSAQARALSVRPTHEPPRVSHCDKAGSSPQRRARQRLEQEARAHRPRRFVSEADCPSIVGERTDSCVLEEVGIEPHFDFIGHGARSFGSEVFARATQGGFK